MNHQFLTLCASVSNVICVRAFIFNFVGRTTRTAKGSFVFALLLTFALTGVAQKSIFTEQQPFSILAPQAGDFTDFQAAANVIGQPNFTTNTPGTAGTPSAKFDNPYSVAVDPTTGKVFVADGANNRVLRFASTAAMANGAAAEIVLGQPNFTTLTEGTTQAKMFSPGDVIVDASGRLWVADTFNCRVLRFDSASTKLSGANADAVLGQPGYITSAPGGALTQLNNPFGLFIDSSGRLWVADTDNQRVVRFDAAATKLNGAAANGFLGVLGTNTVTQNTMNFPSDVTVDTGGRLYVADTANSRVLRFDNAATKANSANADAVFGQPNFTTGTIVAPTQSRMNFPGGVSTDANNRLYVADSTNQRVLIFNNAATAPATGALAARVLGQPNFTSSTVNNGGISAKSLSAPNQLFFNEATSSLLVADRANHRVLRFAAPVTPTAASVSISGRVITQQELGLTNAFVTLTDMQGNSRTVMTGKFGSFRFIDVMAGETYILSVTSKRYTYAPQVVTVIEDVVGLTFNAQ